MASFTINDRFQLEGSEVRVENGVLYVDGRREGEFPDEVLNLHADGPVRVQADIPVSSTTVTRGRSAGAASAQAAGGARSDAAAFASGGGGEGQAEGEDPAAAASRLGETMAKAFPPGFPFGHKGKK